MNDLDAVLLELAPAYALDALDAEEARRFEAFLATSEAAQREVAEYREVAALLALRGDVAPSDTLRARVLAAAARPETRLPSPGSLPIRAARPPVIPWLAAAAAIALAVTFWRGTGTLQRDIAQRDSLVTARNAELARQNATLGALLGPGVEVYELGTTGAATPAMKVFVDRARQRAMVSAYRLQAPAPGRAYQLWFIRDGVPVPSVTFSPDSSGAALIADVEIPTGGTVSAAAVTEEPAGGSIAPTTAPFLAGAIRRS